MKSWWTQGGHAQSLTFISQARHFEAVWHPASDEHALVIALQTSGGGGARIAGKLMDVLEMKQKSEQAATICLLRQPDLRESEK